MASQAPAILEGTSERTHDKKARTEKLKRTVVVDRRERKRAETVPHRWEYQMQLVTDPTVNMRDWSGMRESGKKRFMSLVRKYDIDSSGKLSQEEMRQMLVDASKAFPNGKPPTEDQVSYVMKTADVKGTLLGSSGDGHIDAKEVAIASDLWNTYLLHYKALDMIFEQFDKSGKGTLNKAEMQAYLTELNDGSRVTDQQVAKVFEAIVPSHSGALSRIQVLAATRWWNSYQELLAATGRSCCVVS